MFTRACAAWIPALLSQPSIEGFQDKRYSPGDKRSIQSVEPASTAPTIRELCTLHAIYLQIVAIKEVSPSLS